MGISTVIWSVHNLKTKGAKFSVHVHVLNNKDAFKMKEVLMTPSEIVAFCAKPERVGRVAHIEFNGSNHYACMQTPGAAVQIAEPVKTSLMMAVQVVQANRKEPKETINGYACTKLSGLFMPRASDVKMSTDNSLAKLTLAGHIRQAKRQKYNTVLIAYDMQDTPQYTYYYHLIPNKVQIDAKCTFRSKQLSRIAAWTAPEVDIQS